MENKFNIEDFLIDINKRYNDFNDFTDLEKSRTIYIELGKYFSYDERYLMAADVDEKEKLFNLDINEIQGDKIICSGISKIYVEILSRYGIKSEVICSGNHMYNKIKIGKKFFKADLICDMSNIKRGFKTCFFDYKSKGELDFTRLKEIDDKIGYTFKGMYMNDVVNVLKKEMESLDFDKDLKKELGVEDLNKRELLEFKINFILKYFNFKGLYSLEKKDFFFTMVSQCMSYEDRKDFIVKSICCLDENSKFVIFFLCHDNLNNDDLIYYFSNEDDEEIVVNKDFLKRKMDLGIFALNLEDMIKLQEIVKNYKDRRNFLFNSVKVTERMVGDNGIRKQEQEIGLNSKEKEKNDAK